MIIVFTDFTLSVQSLFLIGGCMAVITLSRYFGAGGKTLGALVAKKL